MTNDIVAGLRAELAQFGKSLQDDATFRIYSMTKPIISVAIMMLAVQGTLTLNDTVERYLFAVPSIGRRSLSSGAEAEGGTSSFVLFLQ
jgi:CubicO group peptidase (beta-lactamase class C family)